MVIDLPVKLERVETTVQSTMQSVLVAAPQGEVDIATSPILRDKVLAALAAPTPAGVSVLVIDLSGVTFLDSTGLGVLVALARRARLLGYDFRIAAPLRPVARLLALTTLDRVWPPYPAVTDALNEPFTRPTPSILPALPAQPTTAREQQTYMEVTAVETSPADPVTALAADPAVDPAADPAAGHTAVPPLVGNDVHVIAVERDGKQVWAIQRDSASRASRVHQTRVDAIAVARRICRRESVQLYVHQLDGTVSHQPVPQPRHRRAERAEQRAEQGAAPRTG